MGTPSEGSQAALAMDAALPFDTSSEAFEFQSESLRKTTEHLDASGIRGTRSHFSGRVRQNVDRISGSIVMQPVPEELDNLLPRILGASESSSDNFKLAETIPTFHVMIDRIAKVFTYSTVVVSRAIFTASQGQAMQLTLELEAGTETVSAAGGFPSITPSETAPYIFSDGVMTIGGTGYDIFEFTLTVDNVVDTERFMNSTTRANIPAQDRIVTLSARFPYTSDETALYDQEVGGLAANLTLTNGGYSTKFIFGRLQSPAESPLVTGKTEVFLEINATARKSGAQDELEIVHDSTA